MTATLKITEVMVSNVRLHFNFSSQTAPDVLFESDGRNVPELILYFFIWNKLLLIGYVMTN